MKKIGRLVKEISEKQIKNNLKESESLFIVKYRGLASPDLSNLRQTLRGSHANLFVVKNSVARRAFKDSGLENFIKAVEEPCGLVFVKEEPANISRILYNFSREHEELKLESGFIKDRVLQKQDIEALAKLPTKEVLRAQLVMVLNSPISKMARLLKQMLRKFVYCLDQIKQAKDKIKDKTQNDTANLKGGQNA